MNKILSAVVCMYVILAAGNASGDNIWKAGVNGNWFNAKNWSLGIIPDSSHNVIISGGGTASVDSGTAEATRLDVGESRNNQGTLNITNGGKVTANGLTRIGVNTGSTGTVNVKGTGSWLETNNVHVGESGNGTLNIENGGKVTVKGETVIADNPGSTGVVNVTGTGSLLEANDLWLGYSGNGTLNIGDGGRVTVKGETAIADNSGSTGLVNVTGTGSWLETRNLWLGYSGNGTLNIENGGRVTANGQILIGTNSGSTGLVNVTGTGSWLEAKCLWLGGTVTLNIENGGKVTVSGDTVIAGNSGSTDVVNVKGTGSWLEAKHMWLGLGGTGTLNIENGGRVTANGWTFIGTHSGSTSVVNVTGTGSWLETNHRLLVGDNGNGTLNIENGGMVAVKSATTIAANSGSTAVVNVTGTGSELSSRWIFLGGGYDSADGRKYEGPGGSGTMTISDGGKVTFDYFKIWAPGTLDVKKGGIFDIAKGSTLNIGTGGHASFADAMNIDGKVHLDGFLSSPASTFSRTSLLSGTGGIITGDVVMNGTLSPGSYQTSGTDIGTLKIDGNYTHGKDGLFVVSIDLKKMTADKLEVTGKATISGGTIRALWEGHVRETTKIDLLTANTLTGSFNSVIGSTALVSVVYDRNSPASVYITRAAYDNAAMTGSQREVSAVLEYLSPTATNDMYSVLAVLDHMMTYGEIRNAYDQITPVIATSYSGITFNTLRQIRDAAEYRMSGLRASPQDPQKHRWNLYAIPLGGIASHSSDPDSGYPGHDAQTVGVVIGGNRKIGSNFVVGIDGGYALTNVNWKDLGGSRGEMGLSFGGVYGGYIADRWNLYARLGGGFASYDTDRRIVFGSGVDRVDRTAKSSGTGILYSGEMGGSYDIPLGKWLLKPSASVRYARLSRDGYTENGAKDLGLTVGNTAAGSLESVLGIGLFGSMAFQGIRIVPEFRVNWHHEYMNSPVSLTSRFAAGPSFVTKGPEGNTDRLGLGIGITADITERVSGFVRFEEIMGDTAQNHNLSAGFSVKF